MNDTARSNLIQDWFLFNDGRWASLLDAASVS